MTAPWIDMTAEAPTAYRVRARRPDEITTAVLHSTGFAWKPTNPRWCLVRAHYAVRRDGSVLKLHDPLVRMRVGSGVANRYAISIEHEGNPRSERGVAWRAESLGAHSPTPEQIDASRELLGTLCALYPSIRFVSAHRHISALKSNCPGPEVWAAIGEWAISDLGLRESPVLSGGDSLPAGWRTGEIARAA